MFTTFLDSVILLSSYLLIYASALRFPWMREPMQSPSYKPAIDWTGDYENRPGPWDDRDLGTLLDANKVLYYKTLYYKNSIIRHGLREWSVRDRISSKS